MASARFLEEALNTDVDESAVSAIVGSLEDQLVTSSPAIPNQTGTGVVISQNHINSPISNGGTTVAPHKHGSIATNGDSVGVNATDQNKLAANNAMIASDLPPHSTAGALTTNYISQNDDTSRTTEPVKIVYTQGQGNQIMASPGTMIPNRVSLPNGTIGVSSQTVLQTTASNVQTLQNKQPTLVIKTSGTPAGAPGLVTVPMNVTSTVSQANNVGSPSTQSQNILSNLQVVNVRPGVPSQQPKGQPARVVLSAPQIVGARPGAPQLTLQSFHGLQPGQQGALLLKTENGQYQLLRVGPAPAATNITNTSQTGAQPVTFRMQTVATQPALSTSTSPAQVGGTTTVTAAPQIVQAVQQNPKDNTKEKCRKFLANLLELSCRESKPVEKSVRTLIQELIDMRVEPEDFCDKLEKLLNASPQPCLIGFLKKSLPLLRHSLATQELTIDGIRPPPANVVYSIAGATPTVQTVKPAITPNQQVRILGPTSTVIRPGGLQQRLVAPVRSPAPGTRMVTTVRQPVASNNIIVSSSQPPALHPVFPNNQLRSVGPGQIRQPITIRAGSSIPSKQPITQVKLSSVKPTVPSIANRPVTKDKEKKTFSSIYAGDDDINDVAAMGGVNLAEESQKILGSTEFVGTKIRSCKEEIMCSMGPLQQKIKQIIQKHQLEEPNTDVAAIISQAAQERIKNLLEKLAIITEHRLEIVKTDQRYEITHDVKGQLKFLEDLDKAERKKHEELEREILLRAAKSRSKTEDPEQAKLKAKAKEMQRVEMEELRQREANATALQAIGPRKKPRLEGDLISSSAQINSGGVNSGPRTQMPLRQRMKKVTLRDLQFLFESEKDLCKSKLLYKLYLK